MSLVLIVISSIQTDIPARFSLPAPYL
uniref:Uncharacterized protein n=1 Tax=Anguilla anguilla TaxID=7936 RepID=A0A0E9QEP7_ANGAN